jgi:hypothetical protein
VFDAMDFGNAILGVGNTREPMFPDSEFRERASSQGFQKLVGVAPL